MIEYDDLKEYLSIILDMEKNVYIQDRTIRIMKSKIKTYGIKKDIKYPKHYEAEPNYEIYILKSGVVFAIIGFVIDIIINWSRFFDSDGVFAGVTSLLHGILPGLGVGIVGGLICGSILATSKRKKQQKELDEEYQKELEQFKRLTSADEERISLENETREALLSNINDLESKYIESKSRLDEFYNYGIIAPKYQHDIVAISSFFQYLIEKRTYCLEYDRATADRGAYNIYNEEAQRGVIISQLNVVIDKLDQVIDNQRTLQNTLREANEKINYLSGKVDQQTRQIKASIQEQNAIQTYNAERIEAELRFMNTMNVLDHINRR